MFKSSYRRLVSAVADAFEFNDAVKLTMQKDPTQQILKGKKEMIAGQFKILRDRITDASRLNKEILELPYEEARFEVERRKQGRRVSIENKRRAREQNEALWA